MAKKAVKKDNEVTVKGETKPQKTKRKYVIKDPEKYREIATKRNRATFNLSAPGDNTRFLKLARASMKLDPIDLNDTKQVEERINLYFDCCEQNDVKPTVVGLANWIGVTKECLAYWKNGDRRKETHQPIIQKAYRLLEELLNTYMQEGAIHPTSGIYLSKVMFGYREPQELVITNGNPLGDDVPAEELARRIEGGVADDEFDIVDQQ